MSTGPDLYISKRWAHDTITSKRDMISIPIKPMTFNSVYSTNRQGRRFMTKEGKEYKKIISIYANGLNHLRGLHEPLMFTMIVHGPWLNKAGKISKIAGDLDGFLKMSQDAICETLEINDSCVTEISARKVMAEKWRIEFNLSRSEDTIFFASCENQSETSHS